MTDPKDRRRVKRLEAKGLRWDVRPVALVAIPRADGRGLAITVQWDPEDQEYLAVAVSTGAGTLEGFLDEHSHQTIGTFPSELEAKKASTDYAIEWLKSDAVDEQCECGPIAALSAD